MNGPTPRPLTPAGDELADCPFLKACRREPTAVTPIWLMRQAGRYMPEYRALRARVPFLELCKRPELATEVTVNAAERLGVDAAILFADILLILEPLGFQLEFAKGEGPIIHNPVRSSADVDRIRPLADAEPLDYVIQAVRSIRAALRPDLPLIGFAGAPFTLACYAIEGGSSRHYEQAKAFMYADPGAWDVLMGRLVDATAIYLNAQAAARAQALQVFDSWVGTLGPSDYRRFVQPHMARLFARLDPGVPTIHFGTDTGSLLELQRDAGGSVIGLDWRVELDRGLATARRRRRRAGEPRSDDPPVIPGGDHGPGEADPRRGRRPARAYLQPRPRHPPHHPRGPRPGPGRLRPRHDGPRPPRPPRGSIGRAPSPRPSKIGPPLCYNEDWSDRIREDAIVRAITQSFLDEKKPGTPDFFQPGGVRID